MEEEPIAHLSKDDARPLKESSPVTKVPSAIYGTSVYSDDEAAEVEEDPTRLSPTVVYRRVIFTTIPVFMGYSSMIVLQEGLKSQIGISGDDRQQSYVYGIAVGFLYIGNLVFRLLHNILFTCMKPHQRVMLSYSCMTISTSLLLFPYFVFNTDSIVFVFLAYMCAGVGIGTFESNLISCLTPLGHPTKCWAVVGIPVGFNSISVGSFILTAALPHNPYVIGSIYGLVAGMNIFGMFFYYFCVPDVEFEASGDSVMTFIEDIKRWRQWFPIIWKHCIALSFDMFCVSLFSSVVLYVYNVDPIPIWPRSETTMPKNAFLGVYFAFSFLGDFISRRVAYRTRELNPFFFWILNAAGVGVILSKTVLVAPFGMFMIMFGNGSIYAQTTRYVDNYVPKQFNLIALSVWLFIGDMGSYIGSQVTQPLRTAIGEVEVFPHGGLSNTTNATLLW